MDTEVVAPSVDLMESMRSVGYTLNAAVADLIDNSIAAGATVIEIDADVVDGLHLSVLDNGAGMDSLTAREALRLAGSVGQRADTDLGRFGLGLKTASLSQARSVTVLTSDGNSVCSLRWDLDHIRMSREWSLLVLGPEEVAGLPLADVLSAHPTGTLVVWHRLDLLLGDAEDPGRYLAEKLNGLRDSLSLVFHRYLSGDARRISIRVNGVSIRATDPFLATNPRTQESATEYVPVGDHRVAVTAFTLPHPSGLTPAEKRRHDLGDGMREAQGLYVYRKRRLISCGHWYGIARMAELTKQTRIRVDVPAELDGLWQLDIKKSRAEPPASFKRHLKRVIDPIVAKGKRVHTYRGRVEAGGEHVHLWSKVRDRGGLRYEVNLSSPTVRSILDALPSAEARQVESLLMLLAKKYPYLDVYQEMAGSTIPEQGEVDLDALMTHLRVIRDTGDISPVPAVVADILAGVEPFDQVDTLHELVERVWTESE